MKTWKIGVAGCGAIAEGVYMPQMHYNERARVTACCDLIPGRAQMFRERFGIPEAYASMEEMLARGDIEIVMDLASIPAHYGLNMQALRAGKHLYSQKPFGLTVAQATEMIETAEKSGLVISASPIHMLRPEIQDAKRIIDGGIIGEVRLVRAMAAHGGPEYFQFREVDPTWFYEPGAGALYDLGVHALHMVTGLLGPANSVSCTAAVSEPARTVRSGSHDGKRIDSSKLYDNYMMHLCFGNGCMADVLTSFCVKATTAPSLEVYGEYGSIIFTGDPKEPLKIYIDDKARKVRGWLQEFPQVRIAPEFRQCVCVSDLIGAIEEGREPCITAGHARHVIEIMCAVEECAKNGGTRRLETIF